MEANNNYTKGEWEFSKYPGGDCGIWSTETNGRDIALVRGGDQAEANAERIVTAVNLHDQLIDTLEQLIRAIEFDGEALPDIAERAANKAKTVLQKAKQ